MRALHIAIRRAPLVLLTAGIAVAFIVASCDPRARSFERFRKLPLVRQMAERECPTPATREAIDQSIQSLAIGPYTMKYETNFLQIDAHHANRRGQTEIFKGEPRPITVNRQWVQIHALAPDMVPNFWADSSLRRRQARGDLYLVGIEVFWSEDGSWRPEDSERVNDRSGPEAPAARRTSIGLQEFELQPRSGWRRKFISDHSVAGELALKLTCSGPYDDAGTCYVIRQPRDDVWIRYSFGSENLRCWRDIDMMVADLLNRFTNDWETGVGSK